jgi:pSer/pThr/pTyr-binding forkhead associated (FHA) protein
MSEDDQTIAKGADGEDKKGEVLPSGLKIFLEVLAGPDKGRKFEINSTMTILGRKTSSIVLDDSTVSSKHASIEVSREDILLYDENSTNGTFVNGSRISSCPLKNLDEIQLGESKLLLSVIEDRYGMYQEDYSAQVQDDDSVDETVRKDDAPLYNPPIPESIEVVLEVQEGPNKGRRFRLGCRSSIIGRKDSDVILDDESVSTRHAQIEVHSKDKMTIKDLASKNGTAVNSRFVSAIKLRHGDKIKIGDTRLMFYVRVKS